MRIYNAYVDFETFGGAELIAINLCKGFLLKGLDTSLVSYSTKEQCHPKYELGSIRLERFSLSFFRSLQKGDVVISHHRKITTLLCFLKMFKVIKCRLIHVAHNEFFTLRTLSIFPEEIIAVSEKVKMNLINFFGVKASNVSVIYNGLVDLSSQVQTRQKSKKIKILYPARINSVKRQLEVVKLLTNHLPHNVELHFAGEGEDYSLLLDVIRKEDQFTALGFVDFFDIIHNYDFVMLFSEVEGLPTVLIEACMAGVPILCNDVGGNLEILKDGFNGYLLKDNESLLLRLKSLPNTKGSDYLSLSGNSRKQYNNKFTFDRMIDNYIKKLNIDETNFVTN